MKAIKTKLQGLIIIEIDVFKDNRGYFAETYSAPKYRELGIETEFIQDNMSYSTQAGTIRGLHWQNPPFAQSKLVSCHRGRVIDVAVDIRVGSPTYGEYVFCELNQENHRQLFIPRGFAHGFLTLSDDVEFCYKVDNVYNKNSEACIRYDDPTIGVNWGELLNGIEPITSMKDKEAPTLANSNNMFVFRGNC